MPTIERPEPPYLQVVRHIREEIVAGRLAEGDTIPSARRIATDWGLALATATKVLATLRSEGLVRAVPGVGTVVTARDALHHSAQDWSMSIQRTGKIYPPGHYARIISAELTSAPEQVAGALGVAVGAPVIRRQRTTYDPSDKPVSTSISWFDGSLASVCPALLIPERIQQGTSRYVEEQTGRTVVAGHDQLAAGAAGETEASALDLDPGSPVLLSQNRWSDAEGSILEFGESISPGGRWAFYEYTVGSTTK